MRTTRQPFALIILFALFSCRSTQPCQPPAPPPVSTLMTVSAQQVSLPQIELESRFDQLENSEVIRGLWREGKVTERDVQIRLNEERSLLDEVRISRAFAATGTGTSEDSRQFVMDFTASLKPTLEREFGKSIGPVPFDPSDLAKPMYDNLAAMIRNGDEVSTYRGDHLAAMPRVEAVALFPGGEQCTGVIIAPNAIATATHCAIYGPTFIRIGNSANDRRRQVTIEPSRFHPLIVDGVDLDMSVLVLPALERIPGIRDEDIPVLATDSMIANAQKLSVVGFGGFFTDSSLAGVKRLGKVPMLSPDCTRPGEAEHFGCHPRFDIVAGARPIFDRTSCPTPSERIIQGGACDGDSGGPVYVEDAQGQLFLAALVSETVDPIDCGCAEATNRFVRFDKHIAWLRSLGVAFPPHVVAAIDQEASAAPTGQ